MRILMVAVAFVAGVVLGGAYGLRLPGIDLKDIGLGHTAQAALGSPPRGCHARGRGLFALPDRRCTPGVWISDGRIRKTPTASEFDRNVSVGHVCSKSYNPRPGTNVSGPLKDEADRAYGLPTSVNRTVEADHYYPRWLGGATTIRNFWPEPNYPHPHGFNHNPKDELEFAIYRLTCEDHKLSIKQARAVFEGSWVAAYRHYVAAR